MTELTNRSTWRAYLEYLERLHERRAAAGERAPDIFSPEYWREREAWRDQHRLNEAECRRGDYVPARRNSRVYITP
jgi:hypothetical protein